jgi:nitronate monooxygenase
VASAEALTPPGFLDAIVAADGDGTVRTAVIDVVRNYDWPPGFAGRALRTRFITEWHGREDLLADPATNAVEQARYWRGFYAGDTEETGVFMSEAVGLIQDAPPAALVIERMVMDAERLLGNAGGFVVGR